MVLVWIVAIGLIGYALWRLASAALGPVADPVATDAKQRIKALAEGIGYGAVAIIAVKVATGSGSSSSGGGGQKQTATVLSWPGGQFLVGLVGLVIIGVGVFYVVDGVKADFTKELKLGGMSPTARKAVIALGRFGRIAQGVVFGIIGVLVMIAAVQFDPNKAKGLDGALKTLAAPAVREVAARHHRARLPRVRRVRPGRGEAAPGQLSSAPTSSAISAVLRAAPLRRLSPTTNSSSVFGKSSACRSRPT